MKWPKKFILSCNGFLYELQDNDEYKAIKCFKDVTWTSNNVTYSKIYIETTWFDLGDYKVKQDVLKALFEEEMDEIIDE